MTHAGGHQERLYRLGRGSDTENWIFAGLLGSGTVGQILTFTVTNIMNAAMVGQMDLGNLYGSVLDHPPQRGPGVMAIPPESSDGRVVFGGVRRSINSVNDTLTHKYEYQEADMTQQRMDFTFSWIHDHIYHILHVYEWDERQRGGC